jgi:AcrR family transcriptional regulator
MSQTTRETHDPRVARSRAAVLEAGVELLLEGGPNAITVDAVSHRSGVAKTTIYRQWDSRDDLAVDVIREVISSPPPPPADMPFEEALRTLMRRSCEAARDDRQRRAFPALLLAKAQGTPELQQLRAETDGEQTARLEDLLRRGIAEGQLAPDVTLDDALLQLLAPLILITCDFRDFPGGVADRIVDLFLVSHRPGGG